VATTPQSDHIPNEISCGALVWQRFYAKLSSAACRDFAFRGAPAKRGDVSPGEHPAALGLIPPRAIFSSRACTVNISLFDFPCTDWVRDRAATTSACRCRDTTSSDHREGEGRQSAGAQTTEPMQGADRIGLWEPRFVRVD